jgi:hypothetical protein
MTHRPLSVTMTLALILLDAALWLAFGSIVALGLHPALPNDLVYKAVLSIAGFGAALVFAGLFALLTKHNRTGYFLTLTFLGMTALTFFLDDVGWADLAFLAVTLLPAALLLKDRNWYLRSHLISTGSPS